MHWHALHWLSVDQRIHFKLCFTGYNVQLFNQPIHVPCSLLTLYTSRYCALSLDTVTLLGPASEHCRAIGPSQ